MLSFLQAHLNPFGDFLRCPNSCYFPRFPCEPAGLCACVRMRAKVELQGAYSILQCVPVVHCHATKQSMWVAWSTTAGAGVRSCYAPKNDDSSEDTQYSLDQKCVVCSYPYPANKWAWPRYRMVGYGLRFTLDSSVGCTGWYSLCDLQYAMTTSGNLSGFAYFSDAEWSALWTNAVATGIGMVPGESFTVRRAVHDKDEEYNAVWERSISSWGPFPVAFPCIMIGGGSGGALGNFECVQYYELIDYAAAQIPFGLPSRECNFCCNNERRLAIDFSRRQPVCWSSLRPYIFRRYWCHRTFRRRLCE